MASFLHSSASTVVELVLISSDTMLVEGEAVLLYCAGYGRLGVDVTWWRGGVQVTNSSLVNTYQETNIQNGVTFKQAFLQLCYVQSEAAGEYTCVVSNGRESTRSSVMLNVSGQ